MKKNKSFSSEFFVDVKSSSPDIKTDYEIFENKDKLDEIRSIIIQNIIDNNIPKGYNLNEYINYEIDRYNKTEACLRFIITIIQIQAVKYPCRQCRPSCCRGLR